jgi:hypothetical protein
MNKPKGVPRNQLFPSVTFDLDRLATVGSVPRLGGIRQWNRGIGLLDLGHEKIEKEKRPPC